MAKYENTLAISRLSEPEAIRVEIQLGQELIVLEAEPRDFALALTGQAGTPIAVRKRIVRQVK